MNSNSASMSTNRQSTTTSLAAVRIGSLDALNNRLDCVANELSELGSRSKALCDRLFNGEEGVKSAGSDAPAPCAEIFKLEVTVDRVFTNIQNLRHQLERLETL